MQEDTRPLLAAAIGEVGMGWGHVQRALQADGPDPMLSAATDRSASAWVSHFRFMAISGHRRNRPAAAGKSSGKANFFAWQCTPIGCPIV